MQAERAEQQHRPATQLSRRLAVACLVGGLLVGAGLSFGSWITLQKVIDDTPSDYELVIPAGTAALVSRGAAPPTIPASIELKEGGSFLVRNEDSVGHQIDQYAIGPGEERQIPLPLTSAAPDQARNTFVCSFHPGNAIELSLDEAPPLTANLVPTFAIGLPLALVSFVVLSVTSRLD
jgi:hypothetical protein